jgi:transcription elongation GreA/GreB family factor
VTVLEDGDTRTYRIVGVDESDPDSGALSWISPKAKAMVGAHVGESRSIQLPRGESTLKIMAIEYR